jgi:uncharacterized membrane protein
MDATRIHLFITHLPVFGLFLGLIVLGYGFFRKDTQVKVVALALIFIAAVGGVIAFQTGEAAEETVENITSVSENTVEEHEEAAELTVILIYALAVLSLTSLYFELKRMKYSGQLLFIVMLVSMITFVAVARTALLGGKIRHTEIGVQDVNALE